MELVCNINCFRAILAKLGNQESVRFATRWCRGLTYTWGFITMKNHLLATYVTTDRINPQTWTHTFKEGIIDSYDRKVCNFGEKAGVLSWNCLNFARIFYKLKLSWTIIVSGKQPNISCSIQMPNLFQDYVQKVAA